MFERRLTSDGCRLHSSYAPSLRTGARSGHLQLPRRALRRGGTAGRSGVGGVSDPVSHRRLAAERVRTYTPENAVIISAIEPVYLERLAGHGSSRKIVPISRDVEYASKLLVRKRIDLPNPSALNWRNGRLIDLRRAGAVEAVHFVASEQLNALVAQAAAGSPIFLDSTFVGESDADVLNQLQQRFKFVPRAPFLYELRLP